MRRFGPVQVMVIGFDNVRLKGEVIGELRRLRTRNLVRLLDLVVVSKGEDGLLWSVEASDLDRDDALVFGAIAGAVVGLPRPGNLPDEVVRIAVGIRNGRVFTDDEVWDVAAAIPPGQTAAIVLLEHRWAAPLREAIDRAGGKTLADAWLRPDLTDADLTEAG